MPALFPTDSSTPSQDNYSQQQLLNGSPTLSSSYLNVPPPQWAQNVDSVLTLLELLLHPIVTLTALLNAAIFLRYRLLHPNLRLILITQSFVIVFYELVRDALVVQKLLSGSLFTRGLMLFQFALNISLLLIGLLGHLLFVERILAFLLVKRYEKIGKPMFAQIALILLFLFAFACLLTQPDVSWSTSGTICLTDVSACFLCFVEILLFGVLGVHSKRKYHNIWGQQPTKRQGHDLLNEKYQLSENIRTSRQLAPTFLFHFVTMLTLSSMTLAMFYAWFSDASYKMSLFYTVVSLIFSLCNWAMEITIITHHPVLRQRAWELFQQCLSRIVCMPSSSGGGSVAASAIVSPSAVFTARTVDGAVLYSGNGMVEHFQMLEKAWN